MEQRSVVLTERQWGFLNGRAMRYGITRAEALRRLLDDVIDDEGDASAERLRPAEAAPRRA